MRYKNVGRSFVRFVKLHAFDRQVGRTEDGKTDGRTDSFLLTSLCIQYSAVKTENINVVYLKHVICEKILQVVLEKVAVQWK